MSINLNILNENQRQAVFWNEGALLVLAGPGSGKTRVLTMRIARLLEEHEDASILALTFTNKAAAEMRERVDSLLGQRAERTHLCTFHSFATDVLRQHGSHLGLKPDFILLTRDEDRIAILNDVVAVFEEDEHSVVSDRKNLLTLLDRLFADAYNGETNASTLAHTPNWLPLLFQRYCAALVSANRLDFGSLLFFTCRLLREKPGVRRVLRLGWTHVCVDEFQDTNKAQYELLKLVVPEQQPNLFVVADDDQIIYQWNGASPERLHALRTDYGMQVIQLPENYRCPPEIIECANKLIVRNPSRTPGKKPLTAIKHSSLDNTNSVIRYGVLDTQEIETTAIANDISRRDLNPADCVVLARTTKLLESAATALRDKGFEAYVAQRKNDFESPLVRVTLNALRLANAPHDREILRHLCLAWKALSDNVIEVEDVAAGAVLTGGNFLRAWAEMVSQHTDDNIMKLVEKLGTALVERLDFPGILDWFLSNDGWKNWGNDDQELADEIAIWQEIHSDIAREHGADNLTLNLYLQQIDLAPKTSRPLPNAIRCLTVHGAKGLEFKHVYLMGMAQEVFPSFHALKKGSNSRELEEERRNCFVAITRVQESLTLTRAKKYSGWNKEESQFIAEMEIQSKQ